MMRTLKILEKPKFWLYVIGAILVVVVLYLLFKSLRASARKEKFDDYALPAGDAGRAALAAMGLSDDAINAVTSVPTVLSDNNNPIKPLVEACEKVKSWDCTKLDDPDFLNNCGICSSGGLNSKGQPHVGGMYIDPNIANEALIKFNQDGTIPNLKPTIGKCDGQFHMVRPHCDTQQDRVFCANATKMTPDVLTRCGQCADEDIPTFVYMGRRGTEATKYNLISDIGTAPFKFEIRLRILVAQAEGCTIYLRDPIDPDIIDPLTKQPVERKYPGGFAQGSNQYIVDVPGVSENQPFELVVKYPEYQDYKFNAEEKIRINNLVNPKRAPLTKATYGPITNNFLLDDPRAADITSYIANRFKNAADCANPVINISNDGAGGDPTYGIRKQMRLAYSNDGTTFAYAYGFEGDNTRIIRDGDYGDNYAKICPAIVPQEEADETVCTRDAYNNSKPSHTYVAADGTKVQIQNKYWGSSGNTVCVVDAPRAQRGITGIWESLGRAPRRVLLEKSVTQINGTLIADSGPPTLGTMLSNIFKFDSVISSSMNIPNHARWFWPNTDVDRGGIPQIAVFSVIIPGTLRDTTKLADTMICPSGPIITTTTAAERLQINPCDKPVAGQPQQPGTYTDSCVKSIFLANGCKISGDAYPGTPQTKANLTGCGGTVVGGYDIATMESAVTNMFLIATTGNDSTGAPVSSGERTTAIKNCFGNYVADPCNTPKFSTGPQTAECLDYLWRNEGRRNNKIGPTYDTSENRRSSGAGTPENPAVWCQMKGAMAPMGPNGQMNQMAIDEANKRGSVLNIRNFYKQIHYDANYATSPDVQSLAMEQCYGIKMCGKSSINNNQGAGDLGVESRPGGMEPRAIPRMRPGGSLGMGPGSGGSGGSGGMGPGGYGINAGDCPTCMPTPSTSKCPGSDPSCSVCPAGTSRCPDGTCSTMGSPCPGTQCPGGVSLCPGVTKSCPDSITGICRNSGPCPDGKPRSNGLCGPCPNNVLRCADGTCPNRNGSCPGTPPVAPVGCEPKPVNPALPKKTACVPQQPQRCDKKPTPQRPTTSVTSRLAGAKCNNASTVGQGTSFSKSTF